MTSKGLGKNTGHPITACEYWPEVEFLPEKASIFLASDMIFGISTKNWAYFDNF